MDVVVAGVVVEVVVVVDVVGVVSFPGAGAGVVGVVMTSGAFPVVGDGTSVAVLPSENYFLKKTRF